MPLTLNRGRHSTLGRTTRKTTRKDVDWVAEMQKILDEKKKEGLVGFHFSLGLLPGETCKYTKQQIAKGIVMLMRAEKKGLFKDVTSEVL